MENVKHDKMGESSTELKANSYYQKYEDDMTMKTDVPACSIQ